MKKNPKDELADDFMRDEYDFDYSKGVRGKYARKVSEENGYVKLSEDVRGVFKTSEEVNNALRSFIQAIPKHKGNHLSGQ